MFSSPFFYNHINIAVSGFVRYINTDLYRLDFFVLLLQIFKIPVEIRI